jgi:hypothetical protein
MIAATLLLAAATPASAQAVEAPRGVQAVALATVEIIAAARGTVEPGPQEPRRQVRRGSTGQTVVEFE